MSKVREEIRSESFYSLFFRLFSKKKGYNCFKSNELGVMKIGVLSVLFVLLTMVSYGQCSTFKHPSEAANELIASIKNNNQSQAKCLFSEDKNEQVKSKKDWKTLFNRGEKIFKNVEKVGTIKMGPPLEGNISFLCKVKNETDGVLVILISEKDGKYSYEDLTTIPVKHWEMMPSF